MPAKFVVKRDLEERFYHVFNRGANKEDIFQSKNDYWMFRAFVKQALKVSKGTVRIHVFCLMPNHYHLLIEQLKTGGMTKFMRSLGIRFGMFIQKHKEHSGHVFEGIYKARLLRGPQDILKTKLYILNNPIESGKIEWEHVGSGREL